MRNIKATREIHGLIKTSHYGIWAAIKSRCHNKNNPRYKDYGAMGITMCPEWFESFLKFYEDMGEKPNTLCEIDRIDNSKGYSKDNCRWVSRKVNSNNRGDKKRTVDLPRGVYLSKNKKKYYASIPVDGKNYHIDTFDTPEQAHEEFKIMYKEWHGKDLPNNKN